jgi:hypothetical protein
VLYDVSIDAAIGFTVAVQALGLILFLPLWRVDQSRSATE